TTRKDKFEGSKFIELLHKQKTVGSKLSDLLEENVDEEYYIDREKVEKLILKDVGDLSGVVPVLTPERVNKRQNGRRFKPDGEPMFTLTAQDRHGVVINPLKGKTINGWHFEQEIYDSKGITRAVKAGGGSGNIPKTFEGLRIRKLTPLECWRLQGFTDEQFFKAKNDAVSNSQLYKQAGNSVTVN